MKKNINSSVLEIQSLEEKDILPVNTHLGSFLENELPPTTSFTVSQQRLTDTIGDITHQSVLLEYIGESTSIQNLENNMLNATETEMTLTASDISSTFNLEIIEEEGRETQYVIDLANRGGRVNATEPLTFLSGIRSSFKNFVDRVSRILGACGNSDAAEDAVITPVTGNMLQMQKAFDETNQRDLMDEEDIIKRMTHIVNLLPNLGLFNDREIIRYNDFLFQNNQNMFLTTFIDLSNSLATLEVGTPAFFLVRGLIQMVNTWCYTLKLRMSTINMENDRVIVPVRNYVQLNANHVLNTEFQENLQADADRESRLNATESLKEHSHVIFQLSNPLEKDMLTRVLDNLNISPSMRNFLLYHLSILHGSFVIKIAGSIVLISTKHRSSYDLIIAAYETYRHLTKNPPVPAVELLKKGVKFVDDQLLIK